MSPSAALQVRVLEFTSATPMVDQISAMNSTLLLVSAHTSALANAVFLPPGSAVLELIHCNWIWDGLDLSFKVHTQSLGDIHHWAWRATNRSQCTYIDPRDEQRFGNEHWTGFNVSRAFFHGEMRGL